MTDLLDGTSLDADPGYQPKPRAHEEERLLLSCLMRGGGGVRADILDAHLSTMFDRYEEVAEAAWEVAEDGRRPDAPTLRSMVEGLDVEPDEPDVLDEITGVRLSPRNWEDASGPVREAYAARRFLRLIGDIHKAIEEGKSWEEIMELIEEKRAALTREMSTAEEVDIRDTTDTVLKDLFAEDEGEMTGIPASLPKLSEALGGWEDGELTTIMGRPSQGKTALALREALEMGLEQGRQVRIHSLEMSREELVERLLSMKARVSTHWSRDRYSDDERSELKAAAVEVAESGITIDDDGTITPREIRARCRQQSYEEGLDAVIIDYAQLVTPGGDYDRREQEVGRIMRKLKLLAKDLEVPVICLVQLNRSVEERNPPRPQISDGRASGQIEEHSDNILGLWRPETYGITHYPDSGRTTEGTGEIVICKQRSGPQTIIRAAWVGEYTLWEPLARREDSQSGAETAASGPAGDGAAGEPAPF